MTKQARYKSDFSLLRCEGCGGVFRHQTKGWFGEKENISVWYGFYHEDKDLLQTKPNPKNKTKTKKTHWFGIVPRSKIFE